MWLRLCWRMAYCGYVDIVAMKAGDGMATFNFQP